MARDSEKRRCICTPSVPGIQVLTFPDGSKAAVVGLEDILAGIYSEGRQTSEETAEEIVSRIAVKNYIPSSDCARKEYVELLLKEYGKYRQSRSGAQPGPADPEPAGR